MDKQNDTLLTLLLLKVHIQVCLLQIVLAQGSTFLDSCDFERENICGMIQGHGDQADWVRVTSAAGGPDTDYSNLGKCTGEMQLVETWGIVEITRFSTLKDMFNLNSIQI